MKVVCRINYCGGCVVVWLDGDRWLIIEECGGIEVFFVFFVVFIIKCLDILLNCVIYGCLVCLLLYILWVRKYCFLFCGFCIGNKIIYFGEYIWFVSIKLFLFLRYVIKL